MKYMKRFNELYRLVMAQPLYTSDLPIMVDGKLVKEMTINYDNEFPVIDLKTE